LRHQLAGGGNEHQDVAGHDQQRGEVAAVAVGKVGEVQHLPFFLAGLLVERDAAAVDRADEDKAVTDRDTAPFLVNGSSFGS
jgi:hypothetical protein